MINIDEKSSTMPFDEARQGALIGHALTNPAFFLLCVDRIPEGSFSNVTIGSLWKYAKDIYYKNNVVPTFHDVYSCDAIQQEDAKERSSRQSYLHKSMTYAEQTSVTVLRAELQGYLEQVATVSITNKLLAAYSKRRYQDAKNILLAATNELRAIPGIGQEESSFEDIRDFLKKYDGRRTGGCTTGLDILDGGLTNANVPEPALYRGDTTIILAPVNIGKTSTMINIAIRNICCGKDVLFITHEGAELDIKMKMLCCLLERTPQEIQAALHTTEIDLVTDMFHFLGKHICYIPYNRAGMTVEDVSSLIRRKFNEKNNLTGRGYDLIVDDYPAKLRTTIMSGGKFERRNNDAIVYEQFVQLALELDTHCVLAIQANREGSKKNKAGNAYLTMEDVAESFLVPASATNVITLNRTHVMKQARVMVFMIDKSRSSQTGRIVFARSDFGKCITHHPDRGGVYTYIQTPFDDSVLSILMARKNGCEITTEDLKFSGSYC
jgi:hypothetical protein